MYAMSGPPDVESSVRDDDADADDAHDYENDYDDDSNYDSDDSRRYRDPFAGELDWAFERRDTIRPARDRSNIEKQDTEGTRGLADMALHTWNIVGGSLVTDSTRLLNEDDAWEEKIRNPMLSMDMYRYQQDLFLGRPH
ncbi:hypothetical protein VTJ49DRAFT_4189 [Mycothermus thermophilus]|uniref:Uncharacterized protein n=1 Tax=Humicola insolens TaxID=85995 RepID=A0ABR3V600_HUMIN